MPGVHCQLFVGREQVYPCRMLLISSGRILTVCSDREVVCNNKSPLQNASFCSGDGKTNLWDTETYKQCRECRDVCETETDDTGTA